MTRGQQIERNEAAEHTGFIISERCERDINLLESCERARYYITIGLPPKKLSLNPTMATSTQTDGAFGESDAMFSVVGRDVYLTCAKEDVKRIEREAEERRLASEQRHRDEKVLKKAKAKKSYKKGKVPIALV